MDTDTNKMTPWGLDSFGILLSVER